MTTVTMTAAAPGEIVAKAAPYYRNTRYILVLGLFLYGLWSIRDGFFKYPAEQAQAQQAEKEHKPVAVKPHTDLDIRLNKVLGVTLPPLSIFALIWFIYRSRGTYRLSANVLHVPGHPPVPLDSILRIDKTRWERKGIAEIEYQLSDTSTAGRLTLDDFIYERKPTDLIVEHLEQHLTSTAEPAT